MGGRWRGPWRCGRGGAAAQRTIVGGVAGGDVERCGVPAAGSGEPGRAQPPDAQRFRCHRPGLRAGTVRALSARWHGLAGSAPGRVAGGDRTAGDARRHRVRAVHLRLHRCAQGRGDQPSQPVQFPACDGARAGIASARSCAGSHHHHLRYRRAGAVPAVAGGRARGHCTGRYQPRPARPVAVDRRRTHQRGAGHAIAVAHPAGQ